MVRYLSEDDVFALLTMPLAIEEVGRALGDVASGLAVDVPRVRTRTSQATLHLLPAAAPELRRLGFKSVTAGPGYAKGKRLLVSLFDMDTGALDAMVEAAYLSAVRTGAATALATRHMARAEASTLATIGAGTQAVSQVEGVCLTRGIQSLRVYCRSAERASSFSREMESRFGIRARSADSAEQAVRGADIVNVVTDSADPVLAGDWLGPGQHVNAVGANSLSRRELDATAVARCDRIVVDARATARKECGDLLGAVERGQLQWDRIPELGELVAARASGRASNEEVTLFKSHGMGIEDIYVAHRVVAIARERGVGKDLPIGN